MSLLSLVTYIPTFHPILLISSAGPATSRPLLLSLLHIAFCGSQFSHLSLCHSCVLLRPYFLLAAAFQCIFLNKNGSFPNRKSGAKNKVILLFLPSYVITEIF